MKAKLLGDAVVIIAEDKGNASITHGFVLKGNL
jgi:hypothetical protein